MSNTATTTAPTTYAEGDTVWVQLPGGKTMEGVVDLDEGGAKVEVTWTRPDGTTKTGEVRRSTLSTREVTEQEATDTVHIHDVMDQAAAALTNPTPTADVPDAAPVDPAARIAELEAALKAAQEKLATKGKGKTERPTWPADKPAVTPSAPPVAERTQRTCPVDWARVAREVRANEGNEFGGWVEILEAADKATSASHVANRIRHGRYTVDGVTVFAAGAFEAKNVGHQVWARYVGTGEDEAATTDEG